MQFELAQSRADWLGPVAAVVGVTTAAAFMTMFIVTIAPALIAETGWRESSIGYLASVTTGGSIIFLLAGGPLMRRAGPIRTLQIGLGFAGLGVALLATPAWTTAIAASFLFGLTFGPTAPVGSEVLQRVAPPSRRSIMFSVKQAGVPLGGVLAGLILPNIADRAGWRATLLVAAGVIVSSIALIQPLRKRLDTVRDRAQPISVGAFLSGGNMLRPLAAVWRTPDLMRLSLAGACLCAAQGTWFAFLVTYLVTGVGLTLANAGALFALMQAMAICGRVLFGWIADRLGAAVLTLGLLALASAVVTVVLAQTDAGWPVWQLAALAACAGLTVSSWNGVIMAELARMSPPGRIGEVASGAAIVVFIGLSAGPSAVASVVALTGRFDYGFLAIALAALVAAALLASIGVKRRR